MKLTFTEHLQILAEKELLRALLVERVALKKQIFDLLAGSADLQAQATAAFERSESLEAKMRAGLPASS